MKKKEKILECKNICIDFMTDEGTIHAVRGIDLELFKGKALAIVGESGSGKSVTVKALVGLLPENAHISEGQAIYNYIDDYGKYKSYDLLNISKKEMRKHINGKKISIVFQDPMTSLDPTMTIGKQIMEGMIWHLSMSKKSAKQRAIELLTLVGIENPELRMKNYPHQFSGGMRQRVSIAIALSCNPDLIIFDEPTTALDVTMQIKILDLVKEIQIKLGVSAIFITHDLGVVAKVADYVYVMYAGKIIEKGTVNEIFYEPAHPYTWGLLLSVPHIGMVSEKLSTIEGNPPVLFNEIQGDLFRDRNPYALNIDVRLEPPFFQLTETHFAATWLLDKRAPKVEMPRDLKDLIESMKAGNT